MPHPPWIFRPSYGHATCATPQVCPYPCILPAFVLTGCQKRITGSGSVQKVVCKNFFSAFLILLYSNLVKFIHSEKAKKI